MKFYHLTFVSKNKKSLNNFFLFLQKNSILNFNIFTKDYNKQIKIKKLTLLKSPHVNKIAQEQFETRFFFIKFSLYSSESLKYLIFLKKLLSLSFSDINLKIQVFLNKQIEKKLKSKILYPTNFKINKNYKLSQKNNVLNKKFENLYNYKTYNDNNIKKLKYFVKILNNYGELQSFSKLNVWVAQLVEQRTENPCVSSSSLLLNKFLIFNEKLFMEYVC